MSEEEKVIETCVCGNKEYDAQRFFRTGKYYCMACGAECLDFQNVASVKAEISTLRARVAELEAEVTRQGKDYLRNEVHRLMNFIADKDMEISELKAKVAELEGKLNHEVYLNDKRKSEAFNAARIISASGDTHCYKYQTFDDYLATLQPEKEEI